MKTVYLLCFILSMSCTNLFAQAQYQNQGNNQTEREQQKGEWKGSYFTVSANLGSSSFDYKLNGLNEKGTTKGSLGYAIDLKYSYFFNPHWGITTGVGVSHYGSKGKLKGSMAGDKFYDLGQLTDDDWQEGTPKDYQLRARITNLEEKQTSYFVEIPLMLSYQTYFGDSARWGMYGGVGVKFQFPVSTKFRIQNGANSEFNVSGKYDGIPTDMGAPGEPPVPQHGYGTISDPNSHLDWDDKAKLKMGIAGTAELGVMYALGNGMDLMLGGYIDYGFNDIKKNGKDGLFTAPAVYHPGADKKVGTGIKYNGMLNSNVTDKIKMISFGGKIALRFKL